LGRGWHWSRTILGKRGGTIPDQGPYPKRESHARAEGKSKAAPAARREADVGRLRTQSAWRPLGRVASAIEVREDSGVPSGAVPTVRRATLAEIIALRHAELRPGMARAAAEFEGDDEPATIHVGAFDADGAVVGCASAMRRPLDGEAAWQLRGMATRADRVRRGVGARVLATVVAEACRAGGPRLFWCNARVGAVAFYETQGWRVISDVFDVPTVGPHRRMRRAL
jgi:GNAT superfamily N-acetyltransferase